MASERDTTDHLSDDPIIRGDIAKRVSTAAGSNGIPQLDGMETDRPKLYEDAVEAEQSLTSSVKWTAFVGIFFVLVLTVLGACFFVFY